MAMVSEINRMCPAAWRSAFNLPSVRGGPQRPGLRFEDFLRAALTSIGNPQLKIFLEKRVCSIEITREGLEPETKVLMSLVTSDQVLRPTKADKARQPNGQIRHPFIAPAQFFLKTQRG